MSMHVFHFKAGLSENHCLKYFLESEFLNWSNNYDPGFHRLDSLILCDESNLPSLLSGQNHRRAVK
jgi:hypothetical protein